MSLQTAIKEIKEHREWQEEQHFLEEELDHLRELFIGVKVIQVRNRYGDFELIFGNAKTLGFNPALLKDLL